MRKKWTLFLALCMLGATTVSANTVADAATTQKEAAKEDTKEATDEKKADDKEAADDKKADEKKADDKEAADDKKADEKKADDKEAKDDKKADEKKADDKEVKEEKKEEKKAAKAEDLKDEEVVKLVSDAYKSEVTMVTAFDANAFNSYGYHPLKADYETKDKVAAYLGKTFSANYTKAFVEAKGDKFVFISDKSSVKIGQLIDDVDFEKATVKLREVKDNVLTVTLEAKSGCNYNTYAATLVNEEGTWKLDSLVAKQNNGLKENVLI